MSNPDPTETKKQIATALASGNWMKHNGVPVSEAQKVSWIQSLLEDLLQDPDPANDQCWITSGDSFIHIQRLEDGFVEIQDLRPVKSMLLELPALKQASGQAKSEECTCEVSVLFAKGCQC